MWCLSNLLPYSQQSMFLSIIFLSNALTDVVNFRLGRQYPLFVIYQLHVYPLTFCALVTFNTGTAVPGFDPIIGQKQGQVRTMTGYDADDLSKTLSLPTQFVISQGGQYFFLPSITTLNQISKTPTPTPPAPTPPAPTAPTTSW